MLKSGDKGFSLTRDIKAKNFPYIGSWSYPGSGFFEEKENFAAGDMKVSAPNRLKRRVSIKFVSVQSIDSISVLKRNPFLLEKEARPVFS